MEAYKQSIFFKADFASAHFDLGRAYRKLGRWQEAVEAFRHCIAVKTAYVEALSTRAGQLRLMCHEGSAKPFKKLTEYEDYVSRQVRSLEILEDCLKHYYTGPEWFYVLSLAYSSLGQIQQAMGACQRALERDSEFALAHRQLATLLDSLGDTSRALKHAQLATAFGADSPPDVNSLL